MRLPSVHLFMYADVCVCQSICPSMLPFDHSADISLLFFHPSRDPYIHLPVCLQTHCCLCGKWLITVGGCSPGMLSHTQCRVRLDVRLCHVDEWERMLGEWARLVRMVGVVGMIWVW